MKTNGSVENKSIEQSSCQTTEKELRRQQQILINRQASEPVVKELIKARYKVEWISDLYNQKMYYKDAIPILLFWLPRIGNHDVKEAIVRALSVPWARPVAAPALIQEFHKLRYGESPGLQWAIGNALSVVADDNVLSDIVDLIMDGGYGKSREMLVVALGNMKDSHVQDFLITLLADDELTGYAVMALGKLKAKKAYAEIKRYQNHPKAWVRKEVRKALSRIEKTAS